MIAGGNDGVTIWSSSTTGTIVQGNYLGTDVTGTMDFGNSGSGVVVSGGANETLIGGTNSGEGNTIAYNNFGVAVWDWNSDNNTILGNSIYQNDGQGLEIEGVGANANDGGDADSGPNDEQNYPVFSQADLSGSNLTVGGTLDTDGVSTTYRIDFYGNVSGEQDTTHGEARYLLGATTVTTDGSGDAVIRVTLGGVTLSVGDYVTATATRIDNPGQIGVSDLLAYGNTSEFAANLVIASAPPPDITSDLAMHLTLDDGSGTTANDATANNNDGNLSGGASWTSGEVGGGLAFDYADGEDYIEVPNSATLENIQEGDFTLAAWFRPDSTPPGTGSDNDASYGILIKAGWHNGLYFNNQNRFVFDHILSGDIEVRVESTNTFTPGQFYHVVGVLDRAAGTVTLYVDGQLEGVTTFTPGVASREYGTETWKIGVANPGSSVWSWAADGAIDDARIYGRSLVASDVAALYAQSNDAPVQSSIEGSSLSYTENDGLVSITSSLAISDADDTHLESAEVQITGNYATGQDVLSFSDQNGITGSWNSTNGTLSLSGSATLAEYEAALRSIAYTNTSENPSTLTRTVSFSVNDGDVNSNTVTRDITIGSVNDDPINAGSLPSDISVGEDMASNVDLSVINLSDVDHGGGILTVTLSTSTGGNLSATTGGGVTVGGSGSGTLTLTGSLANLNTFLDTASNVSYLHSTAHFNGNDADTINVVVNDNGNTGTGGGTNQNLGTVNVDIGAVNDAPAQYGAGHTDGG